VVKLVRSDILTTEVLDWKGVHLFHFMNSSCSQKTRIFLTEKGVEWESHPINLMTHENFTDWYLGINPRGLVPTLVHDGDVHIESNDIMRYVDETFDGPRLFPQDDASLAYVIESAKREDDLHLCVRSLTFRYMAPNELLRKDPDALDVYEKAGSGQVGGDADTHKAVEVAFWRKMAVDGIPIEQAIAAVEAFEPHFSELNARLGEHEWLMPGGFSVLDIIWWISVHRLKFLGYPLERFPELDGWYATLAERPHFLAEVAMPPERVTGAKQYQDDMANAGESLPQIMAAHGF
jgi:glutathione S-transferase